MGDEEKGGPDVWLVVAFHQGGGMPSRRAGQGRGKSRSSLARWSVGCPSALSFWAGNGEQGHRGKVWAEGRKYGWCLNPWDSIVFEFIELIGHLGRTREQGRTGPRVAIFRGRIAETPEENTDLYIVFALFIISEIGKGI